MFVYRVRVRPSVRRLPAAQICQTCCGAEGREEGGGGGGGQRKRGEEKARQGERAKAREKKRDKERERTRERKKEKERMVAAGEDSIGGCHKYI